MPEMILAQPSCDMAMMRAYVSAGWRNVMLDLEHCPLAEADVVSASIALTSAGGTLYLKLADADPEVCARYLRFGIRNFVLPKVADATVIRAIRTEMEEVFWVDPATIRLFPLIETQAAIKHIPSICSEENVAALMVGPGDLARDMGHSFRTLGELEELGRLLTPALLEALDAIRACGKPAGCGFVRSWLEFFPMDRVDLATLQLVDVASIHTLPGDPAR